MKRPDPKGSWKHRLHWWFVNFCFYEVTPVALPVFFETYLAIIYTDRNWSNTGNLVASMVTGLLMDMVGQVLGLMQAGLLSKASSGSRGSCWTALRKACSMIGAVLGVVFGGVLNIPHALHSVSISDSTY